MADVDVFMDIPAVQDMSKKFDVISDILNAVNKALEALANILKVTAFIGLVGGFALLHFIETIRPQIEKMAEKCAELSSDLTASVNAYERGDNQGATRFY